MSYGLNDHDVKQIRAIFSQFPATEKVVLYGSRAKGTYKNGSDIDLCIFGKNLTKSTLYEIDLALDELYLPYSFDLSLYTELENKELKDHITRMGIIFYQVE